MANEVGKKDVPSEERVEVEKGRRGNGRGQVSDGGDRGAGGRDGMMERVGTDKTGLFSAGYNRLPRPDKNRSLLRPDKSAEKSAGGKKSRPGKKKPAERENRKTFF